MPETAGTRVPLVFVTEAMALSNVNGGFYVGRDEFNLRHDEVVSRRRRTGALHENFGALVGQQQPCQAA